MDVELLINNSSDARAKYVSWAPSPCRIRLTDSTGATQPVRVTLRNKPATTGARVVFYSSLTASPRATLTLTLPLSGASVDFFVAGKFGRPSLADGDVAIQVRRSSTVLAEVPLMVRIRKNANRLTAAERDRFVAAFALLNNQGTGRFADFRNMHTNAGSPEAHFAPAMNELLRLGDELAAKNIGIDFFSLWQGGLGGGSRP